MENPVSDKIGYIEQWGATPLPESARHGRASDLLSVFFGSQMNYASLLLGALPFTFGLDPIQALSAIIVGAFLGALGVGGMAMMSAVTGANSLMTSMAFFGVKGRVTGSVIIQVIDIGYFAIGIWVGAPQLQSVFNALGIPSSVVPLGMCIVLCGLLVIGVALLGHATIVAYEKLVSCCGLISILVLAGSVWMWPAGTPETAGYAGGNVWTAWMLAVSCHLGNAISYAPFAGDYARYLPRKTQPAALFLGAASGIFMGCVTACGFGLFMALRVPHPVNLTGEMLACLSPMLLLPVSIGALAANSCNGAMVVYNGVLNLHALLYRQRRSSVAILFGGTGLLLGYVGLVMLRMADGLMALSAIVNLIVTPWVGINVVGYFKVKGQFDIGPMCDPHGASRVYRYHNGVSLAAVSAWCISVLVGLPFCANDFFTGFAAAWMGGVDCGFVVSGISASLIYLAFGRPDTVNTPRTVPHATRVFMI
ncbi:MAG: cytosine permease [Acetobacter sp.]|uniref:purine-cytosine permease family protein n=1 Tax=Acetobacter sp. TaxID=440 RepID=UPI0039EB8809